jgi:hypothetical protein
VYKRQAVVAGTTTVAADEKLQWKAAADANGSDLNAFTVKAYDGSLASDTAIQVKTAVAAADDAGSITAIAGGSVAQGVQLTAGQISDIDGGVTVTGHQWQVSDNGTSGWAAIDNATTQNFTPAQAQVGKFLRVVVTYSDALGANKTVTSTATSVAVADNVDPTISGLPVSTQSVTVGVGATLADFAVADADNTNLTVTLTATNGTIGGVADAIPGTPGTQLTGTAAQINAELAAATFTATGTGAANIAVSVSDGVNTAVQGTYNLLAAAAPPTLSAAPQVTSFTNLIDNSEQIGATSKLSLIHI